MRLDAFIAGLGILLLTASAAADPAGSRGLTVPLRASAAADAPVVEEVELYSTSRALVIGIDDYTGGWPRLSNAVNDAEAVAQALEAQGFEVTLRRNLASAELEQAFREFFVRGGDDPDARLFVWFAGHGHTERGEGFIVPKDAPLPKAGAAFRFKALSLRRFGEYVRLAQSKHAFAVFDSCFSDTVFESARPAPPPAITRATVKPVRQFLSSGDAGQEVSDDGTFRRMFLEAITGRREADLNGDGYLTASELGLFLTDRVTNYSNRRQTPRYGKLNDPDYDRGDFVFRLASLAPGRTAVGKDSGLTAEMLFWQSIRGSKRAADYDAYLQQFPDGTFAALARSRKAALAAPQGARATPPAIEALNETFVIVRTANIRAGPDVGSEKLATLPVDTGLQVTGRTQGGEWYRIAYRGEDAFIFHSLVRPVDTGELAAWKEIAETRDREKVEVFLGDHPDGFYAGRAKRLLAALAPRAKPEPEPTSRKPKPQPGDVFRDCAGGEVAMAGGAPPAGVFCGPEMVAIPPGSFRMGDPSGAGRGSEKPVHEVRIGYGFAVGRYEVTFEEWDACVRAGGCTHRADDQSRGRGRRPVIDVNWYDAVEYTTWLSRRTGRPYRLLTEAEWEYMARAGSTTSFPWGDAAGSNRANCEDCGSRWSDERTAPVGSFPPNAFGVHDTVGNVREWVADCHDYNAYRNHRRYPAMVGNWEPLCRQRVWRGSDWATPASFGQSHKRWAEMPSGHYSRTLVLGFRVASAPAGAEAKGGRVKSGSTTGPGLEITYADVEKFVLEDFDVREGPGMEDGKVGLVLAGETAQLTGHTEVGNARWYRIALGGRAGFIPGRLLGDEKPRIDPSARFRAKTIFLGLLWAEVWRRNFNLLLEEESAKARRYGTAEAYMQAKPESADGIAKYHLLRDGAELTVGSQSLQYVYKRKDREARVSLPPDHEESPDRIAIYAPAVGKIADLVLEDIDPPDPGDTTYLTNALRRIEARF